jgi:hypothetical protein
MFDLILCIIIIIIIIIMILFIASKTLNDSGFESDTKYTVSCKWRRWGCCNDQVTPKLNIFGSNCRGF